MSERQEGTPVIAGHTDVVDKDLTGRNSLVSNVLFNWGAYSVFIVAGFIMPRMIDRRLGQELLGVWDFAWSLVNYFGLVQAGISSSVNCYVAGYRAAGDILAVNRVISSAFCILVGAGTLVLGLTVAASLLLPRLFGDRLGRNVQEAQWVVLFLGTSLAVQITFSVFSGILTGCHRWELHNLNTSGWYAVTVAGMVTALLLGGGLWTLAAITLAGEILSSARRAMLAYGVCEGLRLQPSLVGRDTMRTLFVFGGKTLMPSVSNLLLNQTISILIMTCLGPAALAQYTRPRALIFHMNTLVNKMAVVLTPTTSSLQSLGDVRAIQELLIKSVRYSFYMALPMVLVLVVFGGPILQLWMGSRYCDSLLPAILAVGYLAAIVQWPVLTVLGGLNAHGRVGIAGVVASLGSVVLGVVALGPLGWGLAGVALAVALPLTVANLAYVPVYACRRLGLGVGRYFREIAYGPLVTGVPFALCLVLARIVFAGEPLKIVVYGCALGGLVLTPVYWRHVIPFSLRTRMLHIVSLARVAQ